jgi:hypothetical protein
VNVTEQERWGSIGQLAAEDETIAQAGQHDRRATRLAQTMSPLLILLLAHQRYGGFAVAGAAAAAYGLCTSLSGPLIARPALSAPGSAVTRALRNVTWGWQAASGQADERSSGRVCAWGKRPTAHVRLA